MAAHRRVAALGLLLLAGCGDPEPVALPPVEGKTAKPLGAAVSQAPLEKDEGYRAALRAFSSITPENAMKWEVVHPEPDRWEWGEADALVEAARRGGRRVRGHPLVWDQQLPPWAGREDLREHVTTLARRYRGDIAQWDVVNEPLTDDGTLKDGPFGDEGFIGEAFRFAKAADPRAELFLNEIAAERGEKAEGLVALAERLVRADIPIDGIGLQNHATSADFPSRDELVRLMGRFERLGLKVEITELDVEGGEPDAFAAAAGACAAAPNCTGVTVWGVTDQHSWKGMEATATLFDAQGEPKPALRAVRDALRG